MSESLILSSQSAGVLTLTLNRPAALNSFTSAMLDQLLGALDAAAADSAVRCVVLTGAGRAFCAGQDLTDPAVAPPTDISEIIVSRYNPLVQRLRSLPVPVVAAVNGVAAGAGANLAFNCDLVLAARSASFIQAFAKIGLVPDTGGTWLLPRLVGRARALGLVMLGDKLPAAEAERFGLVWKCVEDASLADEARALAERLAGMPTRALAVSRQCVDNALGLSIEEALAAEARLQSDLARAHDYQEGVAAFTQKRAPKFTDR